MNDVIRCRPFVCLRQCRICEEGRAISLCAMAVLQQIDEEVKEIEETKQMVGSPTGLATAAAVQLMFR